MKIKTKLVLSFVLVVFLVSIASYVFQNNYEKVELSPTGDSFETDTAGGISVQFIFFIFLLVLVSGLVALIISNSIIRPIHKIKENLDDFGNGKKINPIEVKGKNEFSELIESFNKALRFNEKTNKDYKRVVEDLRIIKKIKKIDK